MQKNDWNTKLFFIIPCIFLHATKQDINNMFTPNSDWSTL